MPAKSYFASAFPEPWRILGIQLRPFSLGHYLKLRQLGNAFVSDGASNAAMSDLLLGIAVCSMSSNPDPASDEFWCWLNQPPGSSLFAKLFRRKQLTPAELDVMHWGRVAGKFDLADKAKLFADYIAAHSEVPAYWVLEEAKNTSGAHWSQAVIAGLCAECGYSQWEAYNAPLCKSLADYLKACEVGGAIRLMSDVEAALPATVLGGTNGA